MRLLYLTADSKSARILSRSLRRERYVVEPIVDSSKAMETAQVDGYDLLIIDAMLPGLDPCQWCRELRSLGVGSPVLVLTSSSDSKTRALLLDCGADDCLDQPVSADELLARLRALIRRHYHRVENRLQVADLVLNPTTHEASRAGRPIRLTALEFRLLECLMSVQGQVVTRAAIIERVWGLNFESQSNIIDVYVTYLRDKIDRDFSPPLIQCIRGVGYVVKAPAAQGKSAKNAAHGKAFPGRKASQKPRF